MSVEQECAWTENEGRWLSAPRVGVGGMEQEEEGNGVEWNWLGAEMTTSRSPSWPELPFLDRRRNAQALAFNTYMIHHASSPSSLSIVRRQTVNPWLSQLPHKRTAESLWFLMLRMSKLSTRTRRSEAYR